MRVITGTARGRRLKTLEGLEVRPTADRVKEGVFSMIQFEIENAAFLDLFAGSGQMGIEALSRGARLAVFIDHRREAQEVIRENLRTTGLTKNSRVAAMEYDLFLANTKDTFDIAFLDPPYHQDLLPRALDLVVPKMSASGIIICEHERNEELPASVGEYAVYRTYRYGKIMITVYRQQKNDMEEAL
ncbi:MAG TPA: 16S rRNA (guanine(966)-N(2))-methyltransferase RsmD [Firmicutes bacterium]|nr:16S rRNA (guanine(966)-N(2))-methyltransferase RsmD [Bacillota bacterium]